MEDGLDQPEQTETGTVRKPDELQRTHPFHKRLGRNIRKTRRAEIRQDMVFQIALVGFPASLVLLRKRQIALLYKVTEQRHGCFCRFAHRAFSPFLSAGQGSLLARRHFGENVWDWWKHLPFVGVLFPFSRLKTLSC